MSEYRNIVFCSDFSKNANHAYAEAAKVASALGATLFVLHVVPGAAPPSGGQGAHTDGALGKLREAYPAAGAEYAVLHGNEAVQILSFAEEKDAGLIVIGARGIGALAGLFGGGSVADRILKNAKIPVLVVPAEASGESKPVADDPHTVRIHA